MDRIRQALLESTAFALVTTDPSGVLTLFNPAAERLLGYRAEELVGQATPAIFHAHEEVVARSRELGQELGREIEPGFEVFVAATNATGLPDERTWTYIRKDGSRLRVLLSVTALRDENGAVLGYLGVARDLSELQAAEHSAAQAWAEAESATRRAEQASRDLVQREVRLQAVFQATLDGIFVMDHRGILRDVNPAAVRLTGYEAEELVGQNVSILMPPEYARNHDGHLQRYLETGQARIIGRGREVPVVRKDGSRLTAELSVVETARCPGQPRMFVGTLRDMTERRAFEEERGRLMQLIARTPDFVAIFELDGRLLFQNEAATTMLGWEKTTECRGKSARALHPLWARQQMERTAIPTAMESGTWVGESALLSATGEEIPVSQVIIVHRNDQGEATFISTIMRDRREQFQKEQELHAAWKQAEAAAVAKTEFLATMSHEIRTPLNGVIGMTDLLAATDMTSEQREFVETIQSSSDALLTLINDILDYSKMEAGKMELERLAFNPGSLLDNVARLFADLASSQGVLLHCDNQLEEVTVMGDPTRIRQVLLNLVSNAVKFTDSGEVRIFGHLEGSQLCLRVSDSGIGMSPEQIQRLGGAFQQADSSMTRRYGGTGLGLSICHRLVQLMQGQIAVESTVGMGTTFTVRVPVDVLEHVKVPHSVRSKPEPSRISRVLVAEDNSTNQRIVALMLRSYADCIDVAENGARAVQLAEQGDYDLILMDGHMPLMDGKEATRRIREAERNGGKRRTPIVALTANALPGDREAFLESGMDDYLSKPVRQDDIREVIRRWRPRTPG